MVIVVMTSLGWWMDQEEVEIHSPEQRSKLLLRVCFLLVSYYS